MTLFIGVAWPPSRRSCRRYTGREDIVLGVPITSRDRPELEPLIGPAGEHACRSGWTSRERPSFRDLLGCVRMVVADAHAHRAMPFERLVERLQPSRALGHTPVFQVMLMWREAADLVGALRLPGLVDVADRGRPGRVEIRPDPVPYRGRGARSSARSSTPPTCSMSGPSTGCWATSGSCSRGSPGTPERGSRGCPLLTAAERHRLLVEWNDTATDYPRDVVYSALWSGSSAAAPLTPSPSSTVTSG